MNFYSPLAFAFAIFLPIILLMYLLKQKHENYSISSILLWQQALKDIEANAPWQKLKRNLLMLLQLLIVSLLIVALAEPFIVSEEGHVNDFILVLDSSASMQMEDVSPSRFEAAKREMIKIVENSRPGTRFSVIGMGYTGSVFASKSSDRGTVINAIKKITVTNGVANDRAVRAILRPILAQSQNVQVMLFGDRMYPIADSHFQFVPLAGANHNAAVTLLSYTIQAEKMTVLSRIANYASVPKTLSLSLYGDEKVLDARDIKLGAGETEDVYWQLPANAVRLLSCQIDTEDDLALDNTARTVVNTQEVKKVLLVTERNVFLEKVLTLMPGLEVFKTNLENGDISEGYRLYIYDGYVPRLLPKDGNILVFNPPAENTLIDVKGEYAHPSTVEKTGHPLTEYVEDFDFAISSIKEVSVPEWGETALKVGDKPAIIAGQKDNQRIIIVGFDIHRTDMPLKPVFPIMMNNFINWLMPFQSQETINILANEDAVLHILPETEAVNIVTPTGKDVKVAPPFPVAPFRQTHEIGFYTLAQKAAQQERYDFFAVNFPADSESGIFEQDLAVQNDQENLEPIESSVHVGYNLGWVCTLLALIFAAGEWWVYNNGH